MTVILKRFSFKNARNTSQVFLRIFSIEKFQSNRPIRRHSPQLFRTGSLRGLSLLECLIVVSLIATLIFSSVFAYQQWVTRNQLTMLTNHFINALRYARVMAIAHDTTVTFCPRSQSHATCGVGWRQGILILNQKNQRVFRVLSAVPQNYRIYWKSTLGESDNLRWCANGFTCGQQGSFLICSSHHALSAQLIILRTGRIRSVIGKISACNDPSN